MNSFNRFIHDCKLLDPPLTNNKYTWSNMRSSPILHRLDIFLHNQEWENYFKAHFSKTLPRITSNHFPVVLDYSEVTRGLLPSE